MKNIKTLITLAVVFCLSMNTVLSASLRADAKTKRIPAGSTFQLEFLQPVSTYSGSTGDSFVATLKNEQSNGTSVILPAGTIVRGSILDVKTAKMLSRGAKLYLDFDHVVTPSGRQIPLDLAVAQFENIYYDGGLYKNLGYGEAVQENYQKGLEIAKSATEYGLKAGDSSPGLQYITTPFCAIGGFFGGIGYFIGDSIADIFRKGKDVYINTGDIMNVKLVNPIDIPVY